MPRPTNETLARWAALAEEGLGECGSCGEVKPLDAFGFSNGKRRRKCKPCTNTQMRTYAEAFRLSDPDAYRLRQKEQNERYRKANPQRSKDHIRRGNLKHNYGITVEQWDEMFEAQGGKCAICREPETTGKGRLHVDHHHGNGKVRSLLCDHCNRGIGCFRDDPALLSAAIDYLASHAE